jgi:glycosyltransferase involved in cell wall biosynthesis
VEKISVIIPCRNEEKYIARCLESVINNDYPKDYMEVFVVDGKSNDLTQKIIREYSEKYSFINLLVNENKTVPYAMNMGIKLSKGDYIIRLDAHSEFPSNYFSKLIEWSKKLNADNVGAVWITEVKNKNTKTNSIKAVLSNKFGVGNSFFRIGINEVREVDTVPFGCYKKVVFEKIGLYDNRLDRDQDIELNKRLKKNGGKIFLLPDVYSIYYARETFYDIAKNNFQTGLWNILTVYLTKRIHSLSLRHFIPLIFLFSLLIPLILVLWEPIFGYAALAGFIFYLLTLGVISLKIKNKTNAIIYIIWSFIVLHFSYGFGSFIGIFRVDKLFNKVENERI